MFAKSLVYSVPVMCDIATFSDLVPSKLALTSPCLMGGWVMSPFYLSYINLRTTPPWSYPLDQNSSGTRIQQNSSDRSSAQRLQQGVDEDYVTDNRVMTSFTEVDTPAQSPQQAIVRTVEDPALAFDPG